MAMTNPNGFMPLSGTAAKDSCLFVKVWRISVRSGKVDAKYFVSVAEFVFPHLLGITYSGSKSRKPGIAS